jgi:hypothetical protein
MMTKLFDAIDADASIERTPEELHYDGLSETFIETVGELGADDLTKTAKRNLTAKLASDYYALATSPEHAKHPSMHYVYEAVIRSHGIDPTPPAMRADRKKAEAAFEADYLRDTEVELIKAQNALRMPRLSKVQRQMHEDDVTFYGSELICHERYLKSAALRRKASLLIEAHGIDRKAPLRYHRE